MLSGSSLVSIVPKGCNGILDAVSIREVPDFRHPTQSNCASKFTVSGCSTRATTDARLQRNREGHALSVNHGVHHDGQRINLFREVYGPADRVNVRSNEASKSSCRAFVLCMLFALVLSLFICSLDLSSWNLNYLTAFCFAQRALCASPIRFRAAALNCLRFLVPSLVPVALPGSGFKVPVVNPALTIFSATAKTMK